VSVPDSWRPWHEPGVAPVVFRAFEVLEREHGLTDAYALWAMAFNPETQGKSSTNERRRQALEEAFEEARAELRRMDVSRTAQRASGGAADG
jgi:hypothetical protein